MVVALFYLIPIKPQGVATTRGVGGKREGTKRKKISRARERV